MKSIPVFSRVSPDEIIALTSVAEEVLLSESSQLAGETQEPTIFIPLSGELLIDGSEEQGITAGPGDLLGLYETLAGLSCEFTARVIHSGIALKIDREDLFDLLGQRSALLRQLLSALLRYQAANTEGGR